MRAVIVNHYGGTPVVAEIPTPRPGSRQVLIKLRAAGVNPMERACRAAEETREEILMKAAVIPL